MLGAIVGDIVGSVFEGHPHKSKEFEFINERSRFTDDSVLTIATADALLHGGGYMSALKDWGRTYPLAGYGHRFKDWCFSDGDETQDSFGNGSAMRVSPVGWAFDTLEEVLEEAKKSASPSHSHPEGIKGAQAVAAAVFMARNGKSKDEIKSYISEKFGYDLDRSIDEIRPGYHFSSTCMGSVPEAIIAFLDSNDFEDAVCNAVSLGGDADTQACIAGAIAEAFYGSVPKRWVAMLPILLPQEALQIVEEFNKTYLDSRYNFFCCATESEEGRAAEDGIPDDIVKLRPESCRWWVRDPGTDEEIWAFVTAEKSKSPAVYFSTAAPVIFDKLDFASFEDAFIALARNGFDLFFENYFYGDSYAEFYPLTGRFEIEPHPIFSSGREWD